MTEIFEARFKVAVQEAPENDKVSRQDLMTFGIVDLVSNDKDNASHQLLGEKFNTWQEDISQKFGNRHPDINLGIASRNNVYSFARELFEGTDEMEIKTIKKKSHKKELDSKENDYKWKKRTVKNILIFFKQIRKGENTLERNLNEYTDIINFFSKLLVNTFDAREDLWDYAWGGGRQSLKPRKSKRIRIYWIVKDVHLVPQSMQLST